jgi:antitoxin component YwqK of YwqJK toxin-antitoxin module
MEANLTKILFLCFMLFIFQNCKNERKTYYNNGNIKTIEHFNNDGKLDGEYIENYSFGNIRKRVNYFNGKVNGYNYEFYENGKLKLFSKYTFGMLNGTYLIFSEEGKLFSIKSYKYGKMWGPSILYYNNGNIQEINHWINGKAYGKYVCFYDDRRIKAIAELNDDTSMDIVLFAKSGKITFYNYFVSVKFSKNKIITFDTLKIRIKDCGRLWKDFDERILIKICKVNDCLKDSFYNKALKKEFYVYSDKIVNNVEYVKIGNSYVKIISHNRYAEYKYIPQTAGKYILIIDVSKIERNSGKGYGKYVLKEFYVEENP